MTNAIQSSLFSTSPKAATPRDRAIDWAVKVMADRNTVFLDTETLGKAKDSAIVDIAIVNVDGDTILDALVNPGVEIPADATAIHGISNRIVDGAPTWIDIYPHIEARLTGCRVVIWNADYDREIIRNANTRGYCRQIEATWQCAMKAYGEFDGTPNTRGDGMKWWKLDDAADHFDIPRGGHRALADAQTARQVVAAMAKAVPS